MSYRPHKQALEGPCKDILKGIEGFLAASAARIESGGFVPEHEEELAELQKDLIDLRLRILRLQSAHSSAAT